MGKTWVLDTETKGTGAQMVPLERLQKKLASKAPRPVVAPKAKPRHAQPTSPREPWKFKVVDLMTQRVLAEDADARATLDLLQGIRSVVDVRVYVWQPESKEWQLLTLDEKKILWDSRWTGEPSSESESRGSAIAKAAPRPAGSGSGRSRRASPMGPARDRRPG
jgi:hypothetical protein